MRATIKNYMEAANRRREEEGEEGFSLIELIIVVVILGVLVAIAIPIFGAIEGTARDNAVQAAAGNGATAAAAAFANDESASASGNAAKAGEGDITVKLASGSTASDVCVVAWDANSPSYKTETGGYKSGPGC